MYFFPLSDPYVPCSVLTSPGPEGAPLCMFEMYRAPALLDSNELIISSLSSRSAYKSVSDLFVSIRSGPPGPGFDWDLDCSMSYSCVGFDLASGLFSNLMFLYSNLTRLFVLIN